ncbi:MAG: ABC transporter permease [Chloroflexi bacterium]|nr:ABC transporter permease [Chloroflexota bacterium]
MRYVEWLGAALHGDFGRSFRTYTPVTSLDAERIGNTLVLTGSAIALAALVAMPLATLSAHHPGGALDAAAQLVAVFGSAVPGLWLGFVLIYVFASQLHCCPPLAR